MIENLLPLLLIGMFVSGLIGCYVANEKGRSKLEGFIFGALFGPIGWIIVALLPTDEAELGRMKRRKDEIIVRERDLPKW